MKIGIPKEHFPGECRVAATPETATRIREKLGFDVIIETGAGAQADFPDDIYRAAGCDIAENAEQLFSEADIILKVRPPSPEEIAWLNQDKTLISFLAPAQNSELLDALASQQTTALAMEAVPRISRAQKRRH